MLCSDSSRRTRDDTFRCANGEILRGRTTVVASRSAHSVVACDERFEQSVDSSVSIDETRQPAKPRPTIVTASTASARNAIVRTQLVATSKRVFASS